MKEKRAIQSVRSSIAAFLRENRRMPSYAEMINLLGVKSKSVVNFWINKLINADIIEKDNMVYSHYRYAVDLNSVLTSTLKESTDLMATPSSGTG